MSIPASLRSRKFWLTVSGIVATLGAWFTSEISAIAAITALFGLITQYSAANVAEKRVSPLPVDNQAAG
jgi:hypothetical protein